MSTMLHKEFERQQGDRTVVTVWYESTGDIVNDTVPRQNAVMAARVSSSKGHYSAPVHWFGTPKGWDGVIARVDTGWLNGKQKAEELLGQLELPELKEPSALSIERKRKRRRGDFGNEVDIHRVNQGQLDQAWTRMEHINKKIPYKSCTMFVNAGGLGDVRFDESMWRAAVALGISKLLSKAGRSLRIVVGSLATGVYAHHDMFSSSSPVTATGALVKDFHEPLDINRLAAMSNIGYHRVFNFRARLCHSKYTISGSMGATSNQPVLPQPLYEDQLKGMPIITVRTCLNRQEAQRALSAVSAQLKLHNKADLNLSL